MASDAEGEQEGFAGLPEVVSLQWEWRRCGKCACRCATGAPHGPYAYLRWRDGGRQRRQYVRQTQVNAARTAVEQRRRLRPPVWTLRQMVAELHKLEKEAPNVRHE